MSLEHQNGSNAMSEIVMNLQKDVSNIKDEHANLKVRQAVLEETQSLVNSAIKDSVSALTDNVKVLTAMMGRMEIQAINTEKNIELKTQELEFKIQQASDCNKNQDSKIEKLTVKEHASIWWQNPMNKLMSGVVAIILLWTANQFGLPIDQILK